jgi:integrase
VPLLPEITSALDKLIKDNPYKGDHDKFIFYSSLPDQPLDSKLFLSGFKKACIAIGVDPTVRNLVFHSWRHFWVSRMANFMAINQVALVSGHKTKAMAEHYAKNLLDEALEKTAEAGAKLFGKILRPE